MRSLPFYIALALLGLLSIPMHAQVTDLRKVSLSDTVQQLLPTDTVKQKVGLLQDSLSQKLRSAHGERTSTLDSARNELATLKQTLQSRLDSLRKEGKAIDSLEQQLHKLEMNVQTPQGQYENLLLFKQDLKTAIRGRVPQLDTLGAVGNSLNKRVNDINEVSAEFGIAPLGKDLKPDLNSSLPSIDLPEAPGFELSIDRPVDLPTQGTIPEVGKDLNIADPGLNLTEKFGKLNDKVGDAGDVLSQVGETTQKADDYVNDIKTIQEEGLRESAMLQELVEQQLLTVDEVRILQQQRFSPAEIKEYEKMIDLFKKEKSILAEMKEKSKELANDAIMKNQAKVDEAIKKIAKHRRKLPAVLNTSNLQKRAANPMKKLSLRERLIPGLTFQTLNSDKAWLQFDPHLHYKLTRNWSAGVGGLYRFSMDPDKITFDNFNSMYGAKVFMQYRGFKGFFLRAETQYVVWKPWHFLAADPDYIEKSYIAAVGIGKGYSITKRIKGNAQTLYHWTWDGADPYKPKIMIRFGFDFSLKKEEQKPWQKKWKAFKKGS